MKKSIRRIGIGPMSPEVIEAVYKYSDINNIEIMLIASKNQIDHSGGYVNNWNTARYSQYCNNLRTQNKNSNVLLCRDHCGPGFNGNFALSDVYKTINSDIKSGFNLIHIDFCHAKTNYKGVLDLSKKAITHINRENRKILIEIGTDENLGQKLSTVNIIEFLNEIKFFLEFIKPEYFVVPTGSLVLEDNQVGFFNKQFVKSFYDKISKLNVKLKEHNADYLDSSEIQMRKKHISALNIAPQFGVNQTMFILTSCKKYGLNPSEFLDDCYKSKKWSKWLYKSTKKDKLKCSILAGHYNFNKKSYFSLIKKLIKQDKNFIDNLINFHYGTIGHYVENYYYD